MSPRAHIELYDYQHRNDHVIFWIKGKVLYHHTDGHPTCMGQELEEISDEIIAGHATRDLFCGIASA